MTEQFTYVLTEKSITVVIDSIPYTAKNSHPNYLKIKDTIKRGRINDSYEQKLITMFDTKKAVQKFLNNTIQIDESGQLSYDGKILEGPLVAKIVRMMDEGFDIDPMLRFLINLEKNPTKSTREELMLFMEANEMPLTPDGYLTAYKSVNKDYKDYHSGKFDNSIGQICEMPREAVNANRTITCSHGLHFAAKEYAGGFGGSNGHLMILKINPADVVSIPNDYNNQKGRCCKYEVIGEVPLASEGDDDYNTKVVHGKQPSHESEDTKYCPHCAAILDSEDFTNNYCWDCEEPL